MVFASQILMTNQNLAKISLVLITFTSIGSFTGCASPGKKTAIGAGAGAATGAAIGGLTEGWAGAGVGAAVGGAIGGVFGNLLDKQSNELAKVAETKRTQDGILVNLKNDLLFNTDSALLKTEADQNISQLAEVLVKYPQDRIRIEGYTDNKGSEIHNEQLSVRRAQAVKNVLIGHGVKDAQIIVLGLGESKPISDNQNAQGRALNRRVELHIDMPKATT
jgi:outer membrane protein OmpA-like peptidoglycan-associated protein